MKDSDYMKCEEVAEFIGVTPGMVYRLSESGKLPQCIRWGWRDRWSRSKLESWKREGKGFFQNRPLHYRWVDNVPENRYNFVANDDAEAISWMNLGKDYHGILMRGSEVIHSV